MPELFTISRYPNGTRKARVVCGLWRGDSKGKLRKMMLPLFGNGTSYPLQEQGW